MERGGDGAEKGSREGRELRTGTERGGREGGSGSE